MCAVGGGAGRVILLLLSCRKRKKKKKFFYLPLSPFSYPIVSDKQVSGVTLPPPHLSHTELADGLFQRKIWPFLKRGA